MRYFATFKGEQAQSTVEIEQGSTGRLSITVGDARQEVDALTLEHGAVSLLVGEASYQVEIEERGGELWVHLRDQLFRLDLADERKARMRAASAGFTIQGKQSVNAPMPGKVVKLLVKVGEEVKEGQGLVVMEAMKMENELKSPKAGKVVEIAVAEGATVETSSKMVVVE